MPEKKKTFRSLILGCDTMGDDKLFLLEGSERFQTMCGAITSIIFFIAMVGYTISLFTVMITRSNT